MVHAFAGPLVRCWLELKIARDTKIGFHPGLQAGMAAKSSKARGSGGKLAPEKKSASCTSKGEKKITPDLKKRCGDTDNEQPNDKKRKTDATTEFSDLQMEEFINDTNELSMENVHLM